MCGILLKFMKTVEGDEVVQMKNAPMQTCSALHHSDGLGFVRAEILNPFRCQVFSLNRLRRSSLASSAELQAGAAMLAPPPHPSAGE